MADNNYDDLIQSSGQQYNVDPNLIRAVISDESSNDPNAVGPDTKYGNGKGLGQLIPPTAKALGVTDPTDPKQAIPAVAKLLSENLDRYGNADDAIRAYHGGTDPSQWGPKTEANLAKVKSAYQQLSSPAPVAPSQPASADDYFAPLLKAPAPSTQSAQSAGDADSYFAPLLKTASLPPSDKTGLEEEQRIQGLPTSAAQFAADNADIAAQKAKAAAIAATPEQAPTVAGRVVAGGVQGVGDVLRTIVDPAAQYLANTGIGRTIDTAGQSIGMPSVADANAAHTAATNQFNQVYSNSPAATIGRAGGNILATLPLMSGAGAVLGGAGEVASAVAPAIAPVVDFASGATTGNSLLSLLSKGALGAEQGATATGLTSSASNQPLDQQLKQGAELGGTIGTVAPLVGAGARAIGNALTGGTVSQEVANLAIRAQDQYGIPLTGGQIAQHPFQQYMYSMMGKLPLSGVQDRLDAAKSAFTKAVSNTFGEDSPSLTPDVMQSAKERIGNVFDRVAQNSNINVTGKFANDLLSIGSEADQVLPASELAPIQKQIANIQSKMVPPSPGGMATIDGETYQSLTRKGSPLDRAANSADSNVRYYAGQIRNALDDALEASASPQDIADLRQARLQYKNLMTIKGLAANAGIEGEIDPTKLLGAVGKSYKNNAFTGAGDIGDLADIGKQFFGKTPNTTSAERLLGMGALADTGAIGGALLSGHPELAAGMAAIPATIIGAGKAGSAYMDSQFFKNRLLASATGTGGPRVSSPIARFVAKNYVAPSVLTLNRLQQAGSYNGSP